jgi:hypothetical protein
MGTVIHENFPQHDKTFGQRLGEVLRRPNFWKHTVPLGATVLATTVLAVAAVEAANDPLAPKECAVSNAGSMGPGAADRIVRGAAEQVGVTDIDNIDAARSAVQNHADGLIIKGDQSFNLCFEGNWAVVGDIYPVGPGATAGPTPTAS